MIFNATNKPSAITRKPVGEKFGSPKTISKQNKSSGRTPNAIRKQLVRKEPSKKVFSVSTLQQNQVVVVALLIDVSTASNANAKR